MKRAATLLLALLLAVPAVSLGSVNDDQVTSQKIKEADGTTGQNTNTGSGVKTGHIQNLAVTGAKLADGAVTDAKISGVIAVSKLPIGTNSASVAAGNHSHDAVYQQKHANVVVIAQSGGDFTNPVAAIASITNASAANPWLIKVMPGVFPVTVPVVLPSFVTLEGSGEGTSEITSDLAIQPLGQRLWCNTGCPDPVATLVLSDQSVVRGITIRNNASEGGIAVFGRGTARADQVTAIAQGEGGQWGEPRDVAGFYAWESSAHLMLTNVTAVATAGPGPDADVAAIAAVENASLTVRDCSARSAGGNWGTAISAGSQGNGGIILDCTAERDGEGNAIQGGATGMVSDSRAIGTNGGCAVGGTGPRVATSLLQGCYWVTAIVNCWDENFLPLPNQP